MSKQELRRLEMRRAIAHADHELRLLHANTCRNCAKAIGKKWPIGDDPETAAKQDEIIAAFNRREGIVDTTAAEAAQQGCRQLWDAGFFHQEQDFPGLTTPGEGFRATAITQLYRERSTDQGPSAA